MALRCARCQTSEIVLETFGVYRCPACGRVDADGRLLGDAATPGAVTTFAPPPPPVTPSAVAAPVTAGGSGAPPLFLAMIALDAVLIVASAAVGRSFWRAMFGLAFLVPLASGKPWARALALVGATLEIGLAGLLLTALSRLLTPAGRVLVAIDVVLQLVWIYTLFRADTVTFFARTR